MLGHYLHAGSSNGPLIEPSELESRRFGLSMGRLTVPLDSDLATDEIRSATEASGLEVVVVRYPSRNVDWFAALNQTPLWAIHADTLLYFEKTGLSGQDANMVELVRVGREQFSLLAEVVAECFDSYRSHYFANPRLARTAIAAGYSEWALSYAEAKDADRSAFLTTLRGTGEVIGFTTISRVPEPECVLVAVRPAHSGKGLYGETLKAVEGWLADLGEDRCAISTQAHNIPVIRSVSERNFPLVLSLETIHLIRERPSG